jgi:hypothetical protein
MEGKIQKKHGLIMVKKKTISLRFGEIMRNVVDVTRKEGW